MRNKLTTTILMTATVIGFLAAWGFQSGADAAVQAAPETVQDPADSSAATQAPAIQDPVILEGWNTLRGLREPVQVGDGMVLSGESLVQFLLESQIPVVWGSEAICGGSSCSRLYCSPEGECSYADGQPGIDPIYLNPAIPAQSVGMRDRLVGELAHEAFHRMRPFGVGTITQLEEYWAFYVGAQLVKAGFPQFEAVDPLDPEQLGRWFYLNGLHGYLKLAPYPGSAAQAPEAGQAVANEPLE